MRGTPHSCCGSSRGCDAAAARAGWRELKSLAKIVRLAQKLRDRDVRPKPETGDAFAEGRVRGWGSREPAARSDARNRGGKRKRQRSASRRVDSKKYRERRADPRRSQRTDETLNANVSNRVSRRKQWRSALAVSSVKKDSDLLHVLELVHQRAPKLPFFWCDDDHAHHALMGGRNVLHADPRQHLYLGCGTRIDGSRFTRMALVCHWRVHHPRVASDVVGSWWRPCVCASTARTWDRMKACLTLGCSGQGLPCDRRRMHKRCTRPLRVIGA